MIVSSSPRYDISVHFHALGPALFYLFALNHFFQRLSLLVMTRIGVAPNGQIFLSNAMDGESFESLLMGLHLKNCSYFLKDL